MHRIVTTIAFLLVAIPASSEPAAKRWNILWISCEDMSPDLGCYGDAYARSPNLDRLATQSVRFTNVFTVAGVCAPSRSGIITGMHPTTIGTQHMRSKGVPPAFVKCFPEYLRAAGYYCTNNNKTDYNFDVPVTAWDEVSTKAHWRGRPDPKQPFFSVFNLTVSHESRIRTPPEDFAKDTARLRPEDRHDPAIAVLPPYYPDTPVVRADWARYHDLITAMDLQAADLLKQLEDDGLADSTVVFFWSDHGRGLPRGKRWLYDSGIRIPLLVRWPGKLPAGTVRDDLISSLDWAPTVLALAGLPAPKHFQGRVFLPETGGPSAPPRDYVFAARDRMDETYDIIRAVRDKRWKYLRNFQPEKPYAQPIAYMDEMPTMKEWRRLNGEGKLEGPAALFFRKTKPVEELFDVVADPHEIRDLAGAPEHREVLERMRGALEKWMKDTGDLGLVPEPEMQERWRPGGKWSVTEAPRIVIHGEGGGAVIELTCPTEGASIAWTDGKGKEARWRLYTGPIQVVPKTEIRVKACRLGFKDSPEVSAKYP